MMFLYPTTPLSGFQQYGFVYRKSAYVVERNKIRTLEIWGLSRVRTETF